MTKATQFTMTVLILMIGFVNVKSMLTTSDKRDILNLINVQRRSLVPSASNMFEVSWDDNLADLAQKAADTCLFEHNYDGPYADLGENLYQGNKNPKDAFMVFYLERENYNYVKDICIPNKYPKYQTCSHYLQVAAPKISAVGCGRANCTGSYLFVCEFDSGHGGYPAYQTGPPCSQCSPFSPWCHEGLCVSRERRDDLGANNTKCAVKCFNCGTVADDCTCDCLDGTSGHFCEDLDKGPLKCSPCQAAGLKCPKNRGIEVISNSSKCNCQCLPGFSGTECEVYGYAPQLNYVGCFKSSAVVSNWNNNKSNISSIPMCNKYCLTLGYNFSALSDGKWCSCGNNFPTSAIKQVEKLCNSVCSSATKTSVSYCGGTSGYGSVYRTLQAVQLILHAGLISSSAYPISPQQFQSQVWPNLSQTLATTINQFCANQSKACCSSKDGTSVTNATQVVMVGANQPLLQMDGFTLADVEVICKDVSTRERRISASLVQQAFKNGFKNITLALDACCKVVMLESFNKTLILG